MKKPILCILFLLFLFPVFRTAFAADGTCGMNTAFTISGDTITFSKEDKTSDALWGPDCGEVFKEDPDITKVDISETIIVSDALEMFWEFEYVEEMDLKNLDVSSVTDMTRMFAGCYALRSVDVNGWDTSNVTNMSWMFSECYVLETPDVSGWDTSNVTDMSWMFIGCSSLAALDVSGWDTSNVTNMSAIFDACSSLKTLDVSGWDTSSVTSLYFSFNGCSSLTTLDVSGWDTSNVESLIQTFGNCKLLESLDVSGWDTSKVENMAAMFYYCSKLDSLDVSGWDTSNVTDMEYMFFGCSRLTYLDVSAWDTSNVETMDSLFKACHVLVDLDVSGWDTSNVINMNNVFCGCYAMTELDISSWDTSKATTMRALFSGDELLRELDVSAWDTSNVTDMWAMFSGCSGLTELDVNNWDTSSLVNMTYLFVGCSGLTALDLSNWDTSAATEMASMFGLCPALAELDLTGWDTSKITNTEGAFQNCTALRTLTLGKNTLITNIFESLPEYNAGWQYLRQGKDASSPMVLGSVMLDGALFRSYDPSSMAGTWTVFEEETPEGPEDIIFTADWNGCFPPHGPLVLPFGENEVWIRNSTSSNADFSFSAEGSDLPEYAKLESLECSFEAFTEGGEPEKGYCSPDNIHIPVGVEVTVTGGTISFEEEPEAEDYRITFMADGENAYVPMVVHIVRLEFPVQCGILPSTGFSSKHGTPLSVRPEKISYKDLALSLQIPVINAEADLVSIPFVDNSWPVEWLDDRAGVLEGSALPGKGYSLIAAHNTLNDTEYGPFAMLAAVNSGDIIYVKDKYGNILRFSVYANELVKPDGFAELEAIASGEPDSLILLTCENESVDGTYLDRRAVFARPADSSK